jgi:hypothetical protein
MTGPGFEETRLLNNFLCGLRIHNPKYKISFVLRVTFRKLRANKNPRDSASETNEPRELSLPKDYHKSFESRMTRSNAGHLRIIWSPQISRFWGRSRHIICHKFAICLWSKLASSPCHGPTRRFNLRPDSKIE